MREEKFQDILGILEGKVSETVDRKSIREERLEEKYRSEYFAESTKDKRKRYFAKEG